MTEPKGSETADLGFDPEALRRKYREERAKRLRPDGKAQYVDVSGEFARYAADPYAEEVLPRPALIDEVEVAVLGGGLSGLVTSARLREAGMQDIRVIDKAGDFGGTWYWNRYPGLRCDVEAYIYMPLLEEVGTMPTEKYATGSEIFAHCQAIGRHYGLYDHACFQTQVTGLTWDEDINRWIITTDRGDRMRARFVCLGSGPLNRPKLPGIPGINDFQGVSFHSSRWNYGYTGGGPDGDLTGLRGKHVAVIGTGASAIQVIPHLAASAEHLYVFQRTPSSVDIRGNRPTDAEWVKTLTPGWQKRRMMNFDSIMFGIPQDEDLVGDRWSDIWSKLTVLAETQLQGSSPAELAEVMQLADFQKMEEIRARVDELVDDPTVAEALKPYYNQLCKRPLFSDDYLQTFNRPNVTLVDTQGRGVDRITETAVVVDGTSYKVDCIIYATGFNVGAPPYEAGGFEVIGRGGLNMAKKWDKGARTLHGMYSHQFPNLFILGGIYQASVTINFPHILTEQATHAAAVIRRCLDDGIVVMEITAEAEDRWARTMAEKAIDRSQFERECTPGYYNNEGTDDGRPTLFGGIYGGGPFEYVELCRRWLATDFDLDAHLIRQ
jgi:cyclohexanone monooxygenase